MCVCVHVYIPNPTTAKQRLMSNMSNTEVFRRGYILCLCAAVVGHDGPCFGDSAIEDRTAALQTAGQPAGTETDRTVSGSPKTLKAPQCGLFLCITDVPSAGRV